MYADTQTIYKIDSYRRIYKRIVQKNFKNDIWLSLVGIYEVDLKFLRYMPA